MNSVLVTGAVGFVGSHLVPWLAQRHSELCVYALVRPGQPLPSSPDGVHYIPWDLASGRPMQPGTVWNEQAGDAGTGRLPGHVDAVLHLAQANVPFPEHAAELFAVNVASTQRLLDYARIVEAGKFVLASSGSVYGGRECLCAEDDEPAPDDYYGATKLASEWLVRSYRASFGAIILRLFAPYGPGQMRRLVPGLIDRISAGSPVVLNPGGRPRFNPIYIADALATIERALALEGEQVINIGGDEVLSIQDMAEVIGSVVGRSPIYQSAVGSLAVKDVVGDVSRMHAVLGPAAFTPFAAGVATMI